MKWGGDVLKIIQSHLRKRKSGTVVLFFLFILASMTLLIGLTISMNINSFYLDKSKELDTADEICIVNSSDGDEYFDILADIDGIKNKEIEPILYNQSGELVDESGSKFSSTFIIFNKDYNRQISPLKPIEQLNEEQIDEDTIFVPYIFKGSYGYKLGDFVRLKINGDETVFKIGGFFEEALLGNPSISFMRFFLSEEGYNKLSNSTDGATSGKMLSVQYDDKELVGSLASNMSYASSVWDKLAIFVCMDIKTSEVAATIFINVIGIMLVAVSILIVVISLIVARFSIATALEDDIQNIGILKAVGYTNKQFTSTFVVEYVLLALLATIISVIITVFAMPVLGVGISSSMGLIWSLNIDVVGILITIVSVVALTALTAYLNAKKTKKITPIIALRSGIQTHSFKKNHIPLIETKFPVNLALTFKKLIGNYKQNIMITFIVSILTFASIFSVMLFYNMVVDTSTFIDIVGVEPSNVSIMMDNTSSKQDTTNLFKKVSEMDGVRKTLRNQQMVIDLKGYSGATAYVFENFEEVEKNTLFDGRFPIHDNELAISTVISDKLGKKTGDSVSVLKDDEELTFIITGITQQISNLGNCIDITEAGFLRVKLDNHFNWLSVYLDDGYNSETFISEFNKLNSGATTSNVDVLLQGTLDIMSGGATTAAVSVTGLTVLIICLILILVIKIKFLRERRNLGLLKALGYTNRQLITQSASEITFVIAVGTIIGGVLSFFATDTFASLMVSSIGIYTAHFKLSFIYIISVIILLIAISFAIALLASSKIRKISPYQLITE